METDTISIDTKSLEIELCATENINEESPVLETEQQKNPALEDLAVTESTVANEDENLNEVESYDLISSKKALVQQDSSQTIGSQTKTCINCGGKYARSVASKCSLNKNFKLQKSSVPSITKSKCSQLSKQHSDRSIAPCQSFDQCSKCNQVIFDSNPSCASFNSCKRCKKVPSASQSKCSHLSKQYSDRSLAPCLSFDQCRKCNQVLFDTNPSCTSFNSCKKCKKTGFSHYSCNSQTRDLKVRSVAFSTCDDKLKNNNSQISSFCGCNSTLKCNKHCEEPKDCGDGEKSSSNINMCPSKEPSQLSMMKKKLQERIDACSSVDLKSDKKKSKDIKDLSLTGKRRHHVKKINEDNNDLDCPSNPCCISDERKERLETVTNKLVQREVVRQKKIQEKREERLKKKQSNQCDDKDECKKDGQCTEETANKCKEYCKKYKKMKYEIELQNYLVNKLNRELQIKISKNYPESALQELNTDLEKEIKKLKEMIEFTIFEQCKNNDLGWGPIPISILTSNTKSMPQSSCGLPKSPSCVSNVSTFSMLEDLNLCQEKEKHKIQCDFKNNRQKHIANILNEIQRLECKLNELKSAQLQLLNGIGSLINKKSIGKKILKKSKFVAKTKSQMDQIKSVLDKANEEIGKIHTGIHLIRNET